MSIFDAIDTGDMNEVMRLLNTDPSLLEGVNDHHQGYTPAIYAARTGRLEMVKVLDKKGANIYAASHYGTTALHLAASQGHKEMVAYLLDKCANPFFSSDTGSTALMFAARNGHVRVALLLLEHVGIQGLEARDDSGHTALFLASRGGHEEMVAHLLRQGARADTRNIVNKSALRGAVEGGHLGVVKLLVDKLGSEALQERNGEGRSLLHCAADMRHEDIVVYLLANGLRPNMSNMRSNRGETALMCGARSPSIKVMRRLLRHMGAQSSLGGQGLDERDNDGKAALHWAVCRNQPANVRALLVAGADPTIMDNNGKTPRECVEFSLRTESAAVFKVGAPRNIDWITK
jgi:ankyrin repeat protein